MKIQKGLFVIAGSFLGCCALATAGTMGSQVSAPGLRPVVSLQGGYASINAENRTQRFLGTDSDVFTYKSSGGGKNSGFIGGFLGAEHALPFITVPGFFMQTGVEYNYFGSIDVRGVNTVGIESQTATQYKYKYNFQTQQVLGSIKLFKIAYQRFHPYGEIGLGAAFNHVGQYHASTAETGSLNLTPVFTNHNQTQFSYSLGLGVDTHINTNIRVGLGYRYSNFGSSSLGNGVVVFNQYQAPVSFTIGNSNAYANQLIARISYVA